MTLDDLAGMVARGFDNAPTKIEMTEGFRQVNQKIDHVDFRVDELHDILARFEEGDILDLQKRIKILERAVKALGRHIQ